MSDISLSMPGSSLSVYPLVQPKYNGRYIERILPSSSLAKLIGSHEGLREFGWEPRSRFDETCICFCKAFSPAELLSIWSSEDKGIRTLRKRSAAFFRGDIAHNLSKTPSKYEPGRPPSSESSRSERCSFEPPPPKRGFFSWSSRFEGSQKGV